MATANSVIKGLYKSFVQAADKLEKIKDKKLSAVEKRNGHICYLNQCNKEDMEEVDHCIEGILAINDTLPKGVK